jgi:hypothetical protein
LTFGIQRPIVAQSNNTIAVLEAAQLQISPKLSARWTIVMMVQTRIIKFFVQPYPICFVDPPFGSGVLTNRKPDYA